MPDPSSAPLAPPAADLLKPVARLLRPLLRLLIRSGVTFPLLAELLRGLYVEVAAAQLPAAARTDSRLSLLTGVHRKEIRRLREAAPETPEVPEAVTLSSQIIARWLAMPEDAATGRPPPLPRSAPDDAPSFERLVAEVTRDLRPRTVLDDWLAQGIVRLDAAQQVVLNTAAFLPRPGTAEQLYYFARNLHDHLAAASANVAGGQPAFLDRAVHYDRLPPAIAARMEAIGREAAQQMLLDINRRVLAMLEAEGDALPPGEAGRRVNLGVYLYAENEDPKDPPRGPEA